jgi:hypothetical protein
LLRAGDRLLLSFSRNQSNMRGRHHILPLSTLQSIYSKQMGSSTQIAKLRLYHLWCRKSCQPEKYSRPIFSCTNDSNNEVRADRIMLRCIRRNTLRKDPPFWMPCVSPPLPASSIRQVTRRAAGRVKRCSRAIFPWGLCARMRY